MKQLLPFVPGRAGECPIRSVPTLAIRFVAFLLAFALPAWAQTLSFTASPNPGGSPLTTTLTWAATGLPGTPQHAVRISGQGFDANVDLATSGSQSRFFVNPGSTPIQSSFTATLWRLEHPTPYSGSRLDSHNAGWDQAGSPTQVNAGTDYVFGITDVDADGADWTTNIPGAEIIFNGNRAVWVKIPGNCPSGDYTVSASGVDATNEPFDATITVYVLGVPMHVSTGISTNLTVTINPDSTSTITASPQSAEAPFATTISWAAADYGNNYIYGVSGPGFNGVEELPRTGSRVVQIVGQPGQNAVRTFTLHVLQKYPDAPWTIDDSAVYPVIYRVTGYLYGSVAGTDYYKTNVTDISTAAVHAGIVSVGQTKHVIVTPFPPYYEVSPGTVRNGVTSYSFNRWNSRSFTITAAPVGIPFFTRTLAVTALDRPTVPTGLNYADRSATSVTLVWQVARDQVAVVGYNVYRGGTLIGTTSDLVYTDSGLSASTAYSYTVKALDGAGNLSNASNPLSVTTTSDFTTDGDHDGIPDAAENALGTNNAVAASADAANQTQQKIHRPVP